MNVKNDKQWFIDDMTKTLVGWEITDVSFTKGVEGGLTLTVRQPLSIYSPDLKERVRKVVLGYTDLGEWIESVEDLN